MLVQHILDIPRYFSSFVVIKVFSLSGHYAYAEGSSPARPGDKIRMRGRSRAPTNGQCVSYYYNMNGYQIGTLSVRYRTGPSTEITLANHTGNMGDKWYRNEVTVQSTLPWQVNIYKVTFD